MEVDPGAALEAQRKVQRVAHLATHLPEATQKQHRSNGEATARHLKYAGIWAYTAPRTVFANFQSFSLAASFFQSIEGKVAEPCEAHPELGEQLDKMQKYMTTKLSDTEPFGVDFPFDPC